jgi:hypothetical protein
MMSDAVLVLNAGSSSIKFELFDISRTALHLRMNLPVGHDVFDDGKCGFHAEPAIIVETDRDLSRQDCAMRS